MSGFLVVGCASGEESVGESGQEITIPNDTPFPDPSGTVATFSTTGSVDRDDEFFQDFGTNQRTCEHCHFIEDGWGLTPAHAQQLFDETDGTHPLFRPVDGANSPLADVSTVEERRAAYSMLLTRGVIRVGLPIPADADFELVAVDDPYGFAGASELSLFRRSLPSTNVRFLGRLMWDGREEVNGVTIDAQLVAQANSATEGHAQAAEPLADEDRRAIADFQQALSTAQLLDTVAGSLDADGARGGPQALAGMTPVNARFDLFDAWIGIDQVDVEESPEAAAQRARRAAIARGQEVFNTVNNVGGRLTNGPCRVCHNLSNLGARAVSPIADFFNIGVADGDRRTADMPLYTLRNKTTGDTVTTTDPGRALVTGRWGDVGAFKVATLRGLSSRAPYFHNGAAATLRDVIAFYEDSLGFVFTAEQEDDLVAFLSSL